MMLAAGVLSLLVLVSCTEKIQGHSDQHADPDGELRQPCKQRRREIRFPVVNDASGLVRLDDVTTPPEPRDLLHVRLRWRRQKLELLLFKNEVTSPITISEWDSGNLTFARPVSKKCFYQGYVKGHGSSYAALSTCGGLSGYIQTDSELLFIQPGRHDVTVSQRRPHLVYTCEGVQPDLRSSGSDHVSTATHQRRVRRAARSPKYLEVKLVVDYSVWKSIGSKERTETYVMTLMNIANTVFQHKTLDVDIRVVVTKLIFLESRQSRLVQVRQRPLLTVNKFCEWSMNQIPAGHPMDYDLAVLLTREKLGPSGYAPITGLCNPTRSCAAIQDEGFTSGFVIAHESAHVFGLFHDGHGNHCHGRKYQTSLMAALVESRLNHFWWSECSQSRMKQVINYLYCLNNKPEIPEGHFPLEATGSIDKSLGKPWSLDFQCRREFGSNFKVCGAFYNDPCNVLWCSPSGRGMCRTKRGPPMPGSQCGQHRECRESRCVYVGDQRPINGHWGSWSRWSDCSTDCGVGVKQRTRACDNPEPKYDGKKCEGESSNWDTCVNQTCDKMEDGRKGECAIWDSLQIRYGTHKWEPHEGPNATAMCKQTCRSFYTHEVVTINVDVADGTRCSYIGNNSNICIAGTCRAAGCDGKLNSTKTRDMCGFCDGDGSQCKIVSGNMTKAVKTSNVYQRLLIIPGGARNIRVERTSEDKTPFLAIKDPAYGTYPLNGDKRRSSSTSLVIYGAMFYYTRENRTHKEAIFTGGPVMRPLEIEFYPNRKRAPVAVDYSYSVHKSDFTLEKTQYKWRFDKWSECSVTCGQGVQKILRKCTDKETEERVDSDLCRFLEKPRDDTVPCHREQCGLSYFNFAMLNDFHECNATCGQEGVKIQKYACERIRYSDKVAERVSLNSCSHLSPPIYPKRCQGPPCKEGEGEKAQEERQEEKKEEEKKEEGKKEEEKKEKEKKQDGKKQENKEENESREKQEDESMEEEEQKDEEKEEEKVEKEQSVEEKKAKESDEEKEKELEGKGNTAMIMEVRFINFRWSVTGNWTGECPCGSGHSQTRDVVCERVEKVKKGITDVEETTEKVDDNMCDDIVDDKPMTERDCEWKPCPPTYRWAETGRYTDCTALCGEDGEQEAILGCEKEVKGKDGASVQEMVKSSFCWDLDLPRPQPEPRSCKGEPCQITYRWQATEAWSDCDCERNGVQTRGHQCQRVKNKNDVANVTSSMCDDIPAPTSETRPCQGNLGKLCPLKWTVGQWTRCSVTCGEGKVYRSVHCGDQETDLDDIRCTDRPPKTSKKCRAKPCPVIVGAKCEDKYSFCTAYRALVYRCRRPGFRKQCCKTCEKTVKGQGVRRPRNALERYMMKRGLGRWASRR